MTPLVTFIIPTIGRKTLEDTIRSLQAQTDPNWEAIIMVDFADINATGFDLKIGDAFVPMNDRRIRSFTANKNSAGLSRNIGIEWALERKTKWIAFVDDDDTLDHRYVALLSVYDDDPLPLDVLVFRAVWPDGTVLPHPDNPLLQWGHVGISYAVRREWFENDTIRNPAHRFIKETELDKGGLDRNEDITLLTHLINDGAAVTICPYVTYFVRPKENL